MDFAESYNKSNDVIKLISSVKHPAINNSLVELGIVQDIDVDVETKSVTLEFVFPFPNIPIKDQLVHSIESVLSEKKYKLEYEIRVMTEEEKQDFLKKESEGWIG